MIEPTFIAQTAEPRDAHGRYGWLRERSVEARQQGCKSIRALMHPEIPHLLLVEGWQEKNIVDGGEPRWQFQAGAPS